ncbi:DPH4 homolog [Achroia grisella]|uniref:DPH4 homolog n=1 Tax=Achroia grisella TaxID=688607 RepID=UPI0027D2105C|nr:DPH4 homolog [Achroia grisella]
MDENDFIDYYKVLECNRTASVEELKRSYQRLILTLHPDKNNTDLSDTFHQVQKAWTVLRDDDTRKQYDAELSCREHSDLLLYDTVALKEMEYNDEDNVYTYNCRCGGTYLLENCDTILSQVIIGCNECSFSIQVNML